MTLIMPTAAMRYATTTHNTSHHDYSSATTINSGVHVHTRATDAKGIARDMGHALKARGMAAQANRGLG